MNLKMPDDEESAVEVLNKFMEYAHCVKLKDCFLNAVYITYGLSFTIKEDVSHRMLFFCTVCCKEMNNIRSLSEHSQSGTHIKNVDMQMQESMPSTKTAVFKKYAPNTLQYKIANSAYPILGCQMIEAYACDRGPLYYKCILCGAHGKMEAMYYHVIGDKHTDKYIKSRITLKNVITITSEMRSYLRKEIEANEPFEVESIRTIRDEKYYPYKWEKEGRVQKRPSNNWRLDFKERKSPPISSPKLNNSPEAKKEIISDDDTETKECVQFSPVAAQVKRESVLVNKSIQAYSYGFLENILMKMNFIVHTHSLKKFDLQSVADLKITLNLLNYALHHLHYVTRLQLMEGKENQIVQLKEQKNVIVNCLGYVFERMLCTYFKNKYEDWRFEI